MKITILSIGKMKEPYSSLSLVYEKRIKQKNNLLIKELVPKKKLKDGQQRDEENTLLLNEINKLSGSSYLIALDKDGVFLTSEKFAKSFESWANQSKELVFLIGGSMGLSQEVLQKTQMKLSFSKMTFPHMLFRVMLLEQTYRAQSILNNEPYHK
ncbi:MAG: 23S rRNA (pseudouridine(1915)-N(3))-methyltransferase RlmH [Candidatus Cloacimonadota bacterium]|nr:MAG: 23S rRNA (pseudouridine(1915)-N(3))-methyltransferase RlmH [Candidatus Cloacimonadota bacterium]